MLSLSRPSIGEEELKAVGEVFKSGWLGMGATVKKFEDELKQLIGVKNAIAVYTGTSALHIAMDACGIGRGDEVIVPSLTFTASVQAIIMCGASPVFCDVCEDTLNMDIDDVRKKINKKTKAVMPVHFSGLACDMDALMELKAGHGVRIIEDAAHAVGSSYKGKKIGSIGDITCFSFDPIKNITCGEGGAVTTNDDGLADTIMKKRILGIDKETWVRYKEKRSWFYDVTTSGFRYHMSNINAAIGLEQLKKFGRFNERKKYIVKKYDGAFKGIEGIKIPHRNYEETAPFNYIIMVEGSRQEIMDFLESKGVGTGVHYLPNHTQQFFKKYYTKLPVTEKVEGAILTLPLYYDMKEGDVELVIASVKEWFR